MLEAWSGADISSYEEHDMKQQKKTPRTFWTQGCQIQKVGVSGVEHGEMRP